MILFLDVNKQVISLYKDDGVISISFQNAEDLFKYVRGKNFLYVTNATETNATEVISLIRSMGIPVQKAKPEKFTYIHVAGEGVIPIDDKLRFRGKYDAHPLTKELIQKIKESSLLTQLVETGKLEMITSNRRKELEEERVREEDEKLGSILVDREELEKQGDHADAEVIDFTSEVVSTRPLVSNEDVNTMSELLTEMEGME